MTAIAVPRREARVIAPCGFAWRVFASEAGKGVRLKWRHRAVTIAGLVTLGRMFLSIQFFVGGGHIVLPVLALTLPALFATVIAYITSVSGAGGIAEEVNGGTLEQAHLYPRLAVPAAGGQAGRARG
jgi:ABC-2 type transport system permease protein